jgi:hypothetical protein
MLRGGQRRERLDRELPGLTGKIPAKNLFGAQNRSRVSAKRS